MCQEMQAEDGDIVSNMRTDAERHAQAEGCSLCQGAAQQWQSMRPVPQNDRADEEGSQNSSNERNPHTLPRRILGMTQSEIVTCQAAPKRH